jgi:hypothetical protein
LWLKVAGATDETAPGMGFDLNLSNRLVSVAASASSGQLGGRLWTHDPTRKDCGECQREAEGFRSLEIDDEIDLAAAS